MKTTSEQETRFEEFWNSGPWQRLRKKQARSRFVKTVKTEEDWTAIQAARDRYRRHLILNTWKHPQLGSTWFNNWVDWVEYEEPRSGLENPGYYAGLRIYE